MPDLQKYWSSSSPFLLEVPFESFWYIWFDTKMRMEKERGPKWFGCPDVLNLQSDKRDLLIHALILLMDKIWFTSLAS